MDGARADVRAPDVVVIGGGVAGGAVATLLARGGKDVVVLERAARYRDRVLGEYFVPWGVEEAIKTDLYGTLIAAGGNVMSKLIHYDEAWSAQEAEAHALQLDALLPGVPGSIGVGHPALCQELGATAIGAGATVLRGVRNIDIELGARPVVRYTDEDGPHELRPQLVIGADGRESMVRKRAGLELVQTPVLGYGAGLLIEGAKAWPEEHEVIGNHGETLYFIFPQGSGKARLYLLVLPHQRATYTGRGRTERFLEAFRVPSLPNADVIADADAAGPCVTWPMNDAWVRQPAADGMVLIGDAAGYTNPLIGQGLSCAFRDARMVSDIILSGGSTGDRFEPYIEERRERGRRLRFTVEMFARQRCIMGPHAAQMRMRTEQRMLDEPDLAGWYVGGFGGPHYQPAEGYSDEVRQRLWFN